MNSQKLPVIGINELVSIGKRVINIPAKIDTGADSSAIWASHIRIKRDGTLVFSLFGENSKYYTGKVFKRTDYTISKVKNSFGKNEIRYRTHFPVTIAGKKINILMNLADRSSNTFKILIGRRSIAGKFLVDVTQKAIIPPKPKITKQLNQESAKNPYKFYKKYVKTAEKGDSK